MQHEFVYPSDPRFMLTSSRGRSLSRPSLGGVLSSAIAGGKRILASRSASAAGAAAVAGAAAAAAAKRAKVSNKVISTPGPVFNPGGAGGWRLKQAKKKRSKKRKIRISPALKSALNALIQKKVRHWETISKIDTSDVFAVFTSNAFPLDPTPGTGSVRANDVVGWYAHTEFNLATCKALVDDAYRRDAYVVSGTSEVRKVPYGNVGDNRQREYKLSGSFDLLLKNNSNQTAFIDVFEVVASDATNNDPLTELNTRYTNQYVLNTGVIAGTPPQAIGKSFEQFWETPKMRAETTFNEWKKKSSYKICLNPGDETKLKFMHKMYFSYNVGSTTFCKGSYGIVFRVQGSLTHSTADARAIHYSVAQADVRVKKHVIVRTRDAVFTGQQRIANNLHDAFLDDITAGDATQHPVGV